jgi:Bacteriophage tail sheath protein
VRITSWRSFEAIFGGFAPEYLLPHSVFAFFANGGREAVIVRIASDEACATASLSVKDLYGRNTLRFEAKDPGAWGNNIEVRVTKASRPATTRLRASLEKGSTEALLELARNIEPGTVLRIAEGSRNEYVIVEEVERRRVRWSSKQGLRGEYDLERTTIESVEQQVLISSPFGTEIHDNLVLSPAGTIHPRDLVNSINERSSVVVVENLKSRTPRPFNLPQADLDLRLSGGAEGSGAIRPGDFIGRDLGLGNRTGLLALEDFEDVGIICLPDLQTAYELGEFEEQQDMEAVQQAVVDFCERRKTCVAYLDVPRGFDMEEALDWRARFDTKYAAIYYPWLLVQNQLGGGTLLVPPSGHLAGLTSNTDNEHGVHRAPANLVLKDVLGLELDVSRDMTETLSPEGVNCMRTFRGRGIRPWGARTLSSNTLWQHLNVRRLFIMIERTISEGCEWAVFEGNDWSTWKAVERQVSSFLYAIWREGMLAGSVPEQAFYVRCDEELNPQEVRDAGEFHCEIGLAPVRPAEFIVFRIGQQAKDIITEEPVS